MALQQMESTQGQGIGGAALGAAGGSIFGAIAGDAGRGAAIGSAVGFLAGWHRRRAEELEAANQQLQIQQQIAAQSAQQLAISQQKLANYNLAFKTCMQGRATHSIDLNFAIYAGWPRARLRYRADCLPACGGRSTHVW
jgi:hypothetical protein